MGVLALRVLVFFQNRPLHHTADAALNITDLAAVAVGFLSFDDEGRLETGSDLCGHRDGTADSQRAARSLYLS